jgi:hypothetical protein
MNASHTNTTLPPSQCFWGSCTYLDLSTCTQVSMQENITTEPITVDEEGCFSTNQLRATAEYQHFRLVSRIRFNSVAAKVLIQFYKRNSSKYSKSLQSNTNNNLLVNNKDIFGVVIQINAGTNVINYFEFRLREPLNFTPKGVFEQLQIKTLMFCIALKI